MASSLGSNPSFLPAIPVPAPKRRMGAPLRVAIVGFGNVGRSVSRILSERSHQDLHLAQVFNRNVNRKRVPWVPPHVEWTDRFDDVLAGDADVVVELIGGVDPAAAWVRRALAAGKSVVTANKQLIAHHGPELLQLARSRGCHLAFGASVAGGIPVLSGLEEGLAGDRLHKVTGILNGTCNYILTRIESAGVSFAAALAEAQKLGYAEADPSDDLEGYDARAKLTIVARVALQAQLDPAEVLCRSITPVEAVDFAYAANLGCTIRQVARAEKADGYLFAAVEPALVPTSSPLAAVHGSRNLVIAAGEYGGETVFSGSGAGGDPTAVAVVSDLVAIHRARSTHQPHGGPGSPEPHKVTNDFSSRHYLRFVVADRPGVLASLANILARYEINIDAVFQKPGFPKERLPFVISLEECKASVLGRALEEIRAVDFLSAPTLAMPILA